MATELAQRHAVLDGVLNVKKEAGWTSHDVVAKLRGVLGIRRIGHAGTLDPAATGVLPILIGKATRITEYLVDWDKEYRAVLRLGEATDTQDATGMVLRRCSVDGLTPESIRAAAAKFQGTFRQLPPMYSAVKVKGVPLYKAARAGRTVERGTREVTVHEIQVLCIDGQDVELRVVCSKGTYIRTICADIGESLGVGGHVLSLERSRVGQLTITKALTVEQIKSDDMLGNLASHLMSLDQALQALPELVVDEATAARVLHGVPVPLSAVQLTRGAATEARPTRSVVRLKERSGRLLALGSIPDTSAESGEANTATGPALSIIKVLADRDTRR